MKDRSIACFLFVLLCGTVNAQVMYHLSGNSSIRIHGTSTISDWVVKSDKVTGKMTFTSAGQTKDTFAKGRITQAEAKLEVLDIKSERGETMDNKMYAALKKDEYPTITFVLTDAVDMPASGKINVKGNVNMAGMTRMMRFDLDVTTEAGGIRLQGNTSLKLSDFHIEPPTAMFGQIETGDDIVVDVNLLFNKK